MASTTALVSSSTNSGTPSVRSTISSTASAGKASAVACDPLRQRCALALIEPVERQRGHVCLAGPGRRELGAEGDEEQRRRTLHPLDDKIELLPRRGIDPMGILEDHQHRPLPREHRELPQQRLERLLLLALGREVRSPVTASGGGRDRQQLGEKRHVLVRWPRRGEQCLQLGELNLGRVLARETSGAFQLRDGRVQCAVLVVRRAEVAQASVRLACKPLLERSGDARLADARLAGKQYNLTLAALGSLPAPEQQLDLLLAPNQRRLAAQGVQRLEAVLDRAFAEDTPGRHWFGKALRLDCAEVLVFEETAGQAVRALRDHHRVRLGKSLQPGGEVRRLTDHRLLLGGAGSDEIADHDQPGRDADTDPQRLLRGGEMPDSVHESKSGPNRPLGVVLVRRGIAEVHQHPVAHVLGDEAIEAANGLGNAAVIRADHVAQVLGIEARGERRRADEIAKHHRKLPPLGGHGAELRTAIAAELRDQRIETTATRTRGRQRRPAFRAEPPILGNFRPAARAFHAAPAHRN